MAVPATRRERRGRSGEYQKVWGADLCAQVNQRGFLVMGVCVEQPEICPGLDTIPGRTGAIAQ